MNDTERPAPKTDLQANADPLPAEPIRTVSPSMADITARRASIAAAITDDDGSRRVTVSRVVAMFEREITQARADGRTWASIAAWLTSHTVPTAPDAARMAYRRMTARRVQARPVASAGSSRPPMAAPSPASYPAVAADSPFGQSARLQRPNVVRRIK